MCVTESSIYCRPETSWQSLCGGDLWCFQDQLGYGKIFWNYGLAGSLFWWTSSSEVRMIWWKSTGTLRLSFTHPNKSLRALKLLCYWNKTWGSQKKGLPILTTFGRPETLFSQVQFSVAPLLCSHILILQHLFFFVDVTPDSENLRGDLSSGWIPWTSDRQIQQIPQVYQILCWKNLIW